MAKFIPCEDYADAESKAAEQYKKDKKREANRDMLKQAHQVFTTPENAEGFQAEKQVDSWKSPVYKAVGKWYVFFHTA